MTNLTKYSEHFPQLLIIAKLALQYLTYSSSPDVSTFSSSYVIEGSTFYLVICLFKIIVLKQNINDTKTEKSLKIINLTQESYEHKLYVQRQTHPYCQIRNHIKID